MKKMTTCLTALGCVILLAGTGALIWVTGSLKRRICWPGAGGPEGARLILHSARVKIVVITLLAALAARVAGWEDLAYEMLERGRQELQPGDLPLLEAVEGRLGEEVSTSEDLLVQELLPGVLRERLMTRP